MANTKSAKKATRVATRRTEVNKNRVSRIRTQVRKVEEAIASGDRATAEAALKAANVKFEAVKYPGTQHGFNNDTTPRFDDKAAKAAWQRTLALFNSTLRG